MKDCQQVELQGTTWTLNLPIVPDLLGDVTARAWVDKHLGQAMIQLRGQLFYENLEVIEYPVDWWQAVKERWFPRWAKRRWPVSYRRYEINAYYPSLRASEHRGYVRVPFSQEYTKHGD